MYSDKNMLSFFDLLYESDKLGFRVSSKYSVDGQSEDIAVAVFPFQLHPRPLC